MLERTGDCHNLNELIPKVFDNGVLLTENEVYEILLIDKSYKNQKTYAEMKLSS